MTSIAARTLPDEVSNPGGYDGGDWSTKARTEIEDLWKRSRCWLENVSASANGNTITATCDPPLTAYARGMSFWLVPTVVNQGGATININAVGVLNILRADGSTLSPGDLAVGVPTALNFDGTQLFLGESLSNSAGAMGGVPDLIIQDQKSSGTNGGTFTSGAFRTRDLNTTVRNNIAGSSLASNQITLPAGTYFIEWEAQAYQVQNHKSILYNATDATTVAYSLSAYHYDAVYGDSGPSNGMAVFTIVSTKAFEIRHQATLTNADDGFGQAASMGTEIYTQVKIWKVGSIVSEVDGIPGGGVTWKQIFSTTTTDADPGDSKLRLNNATQASATQAFIDLADASLNSLTTLIDSLDDGTSVVLGRLRLVKYDDPTKFLTFKLTAVTTASGYRKLTITNTGSGPTTSPFSNNDVLLVTFTETGDKGDSGSFGLNYIYSTNTAASDPGSTFVRFSSTTFSSITAMYISETDENSVNIAAELATWVATSGFAGKLKIVKRNAPANYILFDVGARTDNGAWDTFTLTYRSSGGTLANNDQVAVTFIPRGDVGAGPVLLRTISFTGAETVADFQHGVSGVIFDTTYDWYEWRFNGVKVDTDETFLGMYFGTGATPTWQVNAGDYRWGSLMVSDAASSTALGSTSATWINLSHDTGTNRIGNAAGESLNGNVNMSKPSNTSLLKKVDFTLAYDCGAGNLLSMRGSGRYTLTSLTAISAVRFFLSGTGTPKFAAGNIEMYGHIK